MAKVALTAVALALGSAAAQGPLLYLQQCDYSPTGEAAQVFTYRANDSTIYNPALGYCIDILAYGTTVGSTFWTAECHQSDKAPAHQNQEFNLTAAGTVVSTLSGLVMDAGVPPYEGAPIILDTPSSASAWWMNSTGYEPLTGRFVHNATGLCLNAGTGHSGHGCLNPNATALPYCNVSLPVEDRLSDLVSRMTLAELISMTGAGVNMPPGSCDTMDPGVPRLGVPRHQWLVETTSMIASQCVNGTCPTSFPSPLNLGATFNRTLWRLTGSLMGDEQRVLNNIGASRDDGGTGTLVGLSAFGPNINVARDPRFGRTGELVSEDPFHSGAFAIQKVRGMQEGEDPRYLKVIASVKHFNAYSLETGRFSSHANISTFGLWDTYLPHYEAAFTEGNASGAMCSYPEITINGTYVPNCANTYLMTTVVRGLWQRPDVFMMSDCGAVANMVTQNHYAANNSDASAKAINAGMDINSNTILPNNLGDAITEGLTTQAAVAAAVTRTLRMRFRAGMFDPLEGQGYTTYGMDRLHSAEAVATQQEGALQGIVLLQNNGSLPLKHGINIAVVGPHANYSQGLMGDYYADDVCPSIASSGLGRNGVWSCVPTISDAVTAANGGGGSVLVQPGVAISGSDSSGIPAALAAVQSSDVVLLCLGNDQTQEAEGTDRTIITLPGLQVSFAQQVIAAAGNKPVVIILVNGGSVSIDPLTNASAIIEAFYPTFGAPALASLLFGDANRWGKLPYTIYTSAFAQEQSIFDFDMTSPPGRTYRYYTQPVLWPFGWGLSYSTFSTSCALLSAPGAPSILINCTVRNTAGPDGDAILFVYHRAGADIIGRVDHPVPLRALVEFDRVSVPAGGSTVVAFNISSDAALALTDASGNSVVYSGSHFLDVSDGIGANITLPINVASTEQHVFRQRVLPSM